MSYIAVLEEAKRVTMGKVGTRFFLTGFYLPNQTFLGVEYSFSFSIHWYSICLIGSFNSFLVVEDWLIQVAKTLILSIGASRETYSIFLSEK